MTIDCIRTVVKRITLSFALTAYVGMPRIAIAVMNSNALTSRPSSNEAIRGALDNVRHRYNQALDYYGLTELYYGETGGVCALKLDKPGRTEPLSILYVRADNAIEYSQVIPRGLARQLINDRMLIDSYQKVLRSDGGDASTRHERSKAEVAERTKLGGRVCRRDRGGPSRPRSTRYRDDPEKARAMNAFNEIRAKRMREEAERKETVEPSMWGKRLLEQRERAAQGRKQRLPESGKGLTISGSRSGKLTLTGQ